MNRRRFLQVGIGGAIGARAASGKLVLCAPLTHSDWILKDGMAWGPEGVKHMLDAAKACGWSHVYWRVLDGGRATYKSALVTPGNHLFYNWFYNPLSEEDKAYAARYFPGITDARRREISEKLEALDYGTFDSLQAAVSYGHQIGLKIHAWITINEDDHAWGLQSDFTLKHPECRWRRRNGRPYRSQLSFAFPEVMEYKTGIVRELVDKYDIDGIFLDWIRTGDVRDNPQTDADGIADHGYEQPLIEAFRSKMAADPSQLPNGDDRWVRFRAEPHTAFMRHVREIASARRPRLPVSALVAHPWCYRGFEDKIDGNLRGMLLDVNTWAREGLVDAVTPAGYYLNGGNSQMAWRALRSETEEKVDVWLFGWVPRTTAEVERDGALAKKAGARQILYWEADYIDDRPNKEELQRAMRSLTSAGDVRVP